MTIHSFACTHCYFTPKGCIKKLTDHSTELPWPTLMCQQEKCSKLIVHDPKLQATITANNHKNRDRALHLILPPSTAVGFVFCTCFHGALTVLRHFTHQQGQLLCRCSRLSSLSCGVHVFRFPSSAWQCTSPDDRCTSPLFTDVFIACIRDFLCNAPKQGKLACYLLPHSSKFRSRSRCQSFQILRAIWFTLS